MSQLIHAVRVLLIACTTGVIGPGSSGGISGARAMRETREERGRKQLWLLFFFSLPSRVSRFTHCPKTHLSAACCADYII